MTKQVIHCLKKAVYHQVFHSVNFPREVRVWSCALTFIHFSLRLTVVMGTLGWGFYSEKYWQYDVGQPTITSKVRGVEYTNFSKIPGLNGRIWDAADYVQPPLENGAKFIMTNMVITPRQTQRVCKEDPSVLDAVCNASHPCQPGRAVKKGHGVMTGDCVDWDSTRAPGTKVCEVLAWCPVERHDNTTQTAIPAFLEAENFTLFVRHTVRFPDYNKIRRNIPSYFDDEQPSCQYDPDHSENKHCPVFIIGKIVELAGHSFEDVAEKGGVFQVSISWKCNGYILDKCWPTYSFARLDEMNDTGVVNWRGFRFRYADHWELPDGTLVRTLYEAIGLRLIFTSEATAFSVNWWELFVSVGSIFGLFQITNFISECFVSGVIDTYDDDKYEYRHHQDSIYAGYIAQRSVSGTDTNKKQFRNTLHKVSIDKAGRDYCSRIFQMYCPCCCKPTDAERTPLNADYGSLESCTNVRMTTLSR